MEEITFSREGLLSFERYEDHVDWVIHSLAPFDTEETMTLTFADGSQMEIAVTDAGETESSANLNDILLSWKIQVGDMIFSSDDLDSDANNNPVLEYKDGMQYSIELNFAERPELGFATPESNPPAAAARLTIPV